MERAAICLMSHCTEETGTDGSLYSLQMLRCLMISLITVRYATSHCQLSPNEAEKMVWDESTKV